MTPPEDLSRHPSSFDCTICGVELPVGSTAETCYPCARRQRSGPMKMGMVVVTPDGDVTGAFVRREGEDWHYEAKS
jgi:hypothetical protein